MGTLNRRAFLARQAMVWTGLLWLPKAAGQLVTTRRRQPVAAGGGETEVATDNFDAYNFGDLSGQGNWIGESGLISSTSGQACSANAGDALYRYNTTFNANQFSEVTIAVTSGTDAIGVSCRVQTGAATGYAVCYWVGDTSTYLWKLNAGTFAELVNTDGAYAAGNKLRLEVTGADSATRLTAKADTGGGWSAISGMSSIDPGGTYINGGQAGLSASGTNTSARLDDWRGGNL